MIPPNTFFLIGPTSVGKTTLSVAVAKACKAEIVGADAFQIYSGMEVLTAAPTATEREGIPHHLFGIIPPDQAFDVGLYQQRALAVLHAISTRNHLPLVVGGNGLYVRALTDGLSKLPPTNPALREELDQLSLSELVTRYTALDPTGANHIDLQNPRRLIRAIEVCELTGKPFSSLRRDWGTSPSSPPSPTNPPVRGIALIRDRDTLYDRINQRVKAMFAGGAIDEVAAITSPSHTAAQVIGYREITAYLRDEISQQDAIAKVQQITRKYAKRQLTWIRQQTHFAQIDLSTTSLAEATTQIVHLAL